MQILVTGSTGFVGSALLRHLATQPDIISHASTLRLTADADWRPDLTGIEVVVHCAARAHVMADDAADPLAAYRAVNVEGTRQLATQAAAAGVKRFIFISSIKVNGEFTAAGQPFTADDIPNPQDAYGISKLEAEQALRDICARTGMEYVILRPPLVYGEGVKGNLASLQKLIARGIPLPFGAIRNQRSLVSLHNLISLITRSLHHPAAANQLFLVADGVDRSTAGIIRLLATRMGKPARLLPVPAWCFTLAARALGKPAIAQRLCGSLQVDIGKTKQMLEWSPTIN